MFLRCSRLQCFSTVTETMRERIMDNFNAMNSKDEQDLFMWIDNDATSTTEAP